MIGSRPKKKKPIEALFIGYKFEELDFNLEDTVLVYSDLMNGTQVAIENIVNDNNEQIVKFAQPIEYNDIETLFFELQ